MPRATWKGAITFGLVLVPVALYPASQEQEIDFDWLDKRTMDPVGYKRVNKRTGKEIERENIVKGVRQSDGDYVLLSDDEIKAAYPKTTQTIEIERFVDAQQIPFGFLEKPYYLEPIGKGEKVYALLREAMVQTGVIGIARVVLRTKEHLAALIPSGPALMLNTLRWADEIRGAEELKLPPAGKSATNLKDSELKMAAQLIQSMTDDWKPAEFKDHFTDAIKALVARKAESGETQTVTPLEEAPEGLAASNVVDLTELLQRSLGGKGKAKAAADADAGDAEDEEAVPHARAPRKAEAPRERRTAAVAEKKKTKSSTTAPAKRATSRKRAA